MIYLEKVRCHLSKNISNKKSYISNSIFLNCPLLNSMKLMKLKSFIIYIICDRKMRRNTCTRRFPNVIATSFLTFSHQSLAFEREIRNTFYMDVTPCHGVTTNSYINNSRIIIRIHSLNNLATPSCLSYFLFCSSCYKPPFIRFIHNKMTFYFFSIFLHLEIVSPKISWVVIHS